VAELEFILVLVFRDLFKFSGWIHHHISVGICLAKGVIEPLVTANPESGRTKEQQKQKSVTMRQKT